MDQNGLRRFVKLKKSKIRKKQGVSGLVTIYSYVFNLRPNICRHQILASNVDAGTVRVRMLIVTVDP